VVLPFLIVGVIYLLFFLSGAAALTYQVVWVRSLTLVFGGSHLAVTAVLSIFMGGLAIGGYAIGRRVDRVARPLRLYGFLELGIAAGALAFEGLTKIYPSIYVSLAQGQDGATVYLTVVRLLFSVVALIVPTILMGGTLPVLSRVVCRQPENLRGHLSFLYGINTLGSVVGALVAGFFLLRLYSVSATLYLAVAVNVLIGLVSLLLPEKAAAISSAAGASLVSPASVGIPDGGPRAATTEREDLLPLRLVLWGIGISGFCALGYEVLWTRVLTIAVGASVYGFTIILVAFLTGIGFGSEAYGALVKIFRIRDSGTRRVVAWFGTTQLLIGITALVVTIYLRDIPANTIRLQSYFLGAGVASFRVKVWANFLLAFLYMVVPALFMGAAFPLAGEALARHRKAVGRTVGDVLSANTVGAVLGAAVSGLLMIRLFGIERSLEILTVMNIGLGLLVLASLRKPRWLSAGVATATVAAIAVLALNPDMARVWDRKYFAVFRSNQPEAFSTPDKVREAVENTDVLYYAEGVESIVSVIRVKGGEQAFLTNGRVEASTHLQAQQVQFTLGHLPMLLVKNPRDVLVVGLGSGMTAGATVVHPSVEQVTLVEIEPQVLGVARTFQEYNHHVLDNPKLKVVLNDGRNFLMTTNRKFDVITADPIHPWFKGAGYLYASEYFALAAGHLKPGGVIAQWLPLYELTPQDLASVVRTFRQHFAHTMLWLVHYDAVMVGSNSPFLIDEADLDKRIAEPVIAGDLRKVEMGSASDLLSYFAMGTEGMKRFGQDGTLNTDDHLYLEFSAPFSIATPAVMASNIAAIAADRESILPNLKPAADGEAREAQVAKWGLQLAAGRAGDPVLAQFLGGGAEDEAFVSSLRRLNMEYPWYAPGKFLWNEYQAALALEPRLIQQATLMLLNEDGGTTAVDMSAVLVPVSKTRASIMFVDGRARVVYGQLYVDDYERTGFAARFAADVMAAIQAAYDGEFAAARGRKQRLPAAAQTLKRIKAVIGSKVQGVQPGS
jgi:spermidine synthase